jgi:topoisomerase IA-like protein
MSFCRNSDSKSVVLSTQAIPDLETVTPEFVANLLENSFEQGILLGAHTDENGKSKNVTLKFGKFGPYVQLGSCYVHQP